MTIFNDSSSEKQWRNTSIQEKAQARQIYKLCKKSNNKHEIVNANNRIMNAIEVIYFPYDNFNGKSWYFKTDTGFEISIKLFNQLISRNKAVKQELKKIKRQLHLMQKTPTERIQAIHDYICETVEYAYEDKARTTLFDAIFGHRVVCCGYSILFKALCDISKIECECVVNENHEWNKITIENKVYFIDATWDDCLGNKKYFMLPAEKFYAIHPMHTGFDKNIWIK